MPTLKGTEVSLSYVQCFLYLISSSVNVSIFHIIWLDIFCTGLVKYILTSELIATYITLLVGKYCDQIGPSVDEERGEIKREVSVTLEKNDMLMTVLLAWMMLRGIWEVFVCVFYSLKITGFQVSSRTSDSVIHRGQGEKKAYRSH